MMINGHYNMAGMALADLSVNGSATIGDGVSPTRISGHTIINGCLQVNLATFNTLKMNGTATLIAATITDVFNMNGSLTMTACVCTKELMVGGGAVSIAQSQMQHIVMDVMSRWSWWWRPTVYLSDNTQVLGDIVFMKNAGHVVIKDDARVLGSVINGECIYK